MFTNFRLMLVIGAVSMLLLFSGTSFAQHQWTSLDGPYWANGIDVAYGMSGNGQAWHRYLIGTDGNVRKLFRWRETDIKWFESMPLAPANKLISYKNGGSGNYAFCSAYDDDIYRTSDGGVNWDQRSFPSNFNRHFSSVEIVNPEQNPGNTIFVGCEPSGSLATTYYTTDAGANWARLGGDDETDPLFGKHIYDIESAAIECMTAGAIDGLYRHAMGSWEDEWELFAFEGQKVVAVENVDTWHTSQIAAVEYLQDRKLYYLQDACGGWEPVEILPDNNSFTKEVRDIAATYWPLGPELISIYTATSEGIYLLDYSADDGSCTAYDLKSHPQYGYAPLMYDQDAVSLDIYTDAGARTAYVVATTPYNVYEIVEERDNNGAIVDINISEIVTGTYKCNVVGVSFPENTTDNKKIFTVSENALVKKYDAASWRLAGLAFTGSGIILRKNDCNYGNIY